MFLTKWDVKLAILEAVTGYVHGYLRKGKPVKGYVREYIPAGREVTGPWELFTRSRPDGTYGAWITEGGRLITLNGPHSASLGMEQGARESNKKWTRRLEEFIKKNKLISVRREGRDILMHYYHRLTPEQQHRLLEFRMAYKSVYNIQVVNTTGMVEDWSKVA